MGSLGMENNQEIASFWVTKLSNWRGKYKRILSVGSHALTTYNPSSFEVTNQWPYHEIVNVKAADRFEFVLNIVKKKKRESMKFTCDFRSELLCEFLAAKIHTEQLKKDVWKFDAFKHHWSGTKLPVTLEVNHFGISQLEPTTKQHLASYMFHLLDGISSIDGNPQGTVVASSGFGRLHIFDVIDRSEFLSRVQENSQAYAAVPIKTLKSFPSSHQAGLERLGQYSSDEHLTSLIEFPVHKISHRHSEAVRRLICMTETCFLERDPDSYRY